MGTDVHFFLERRTNGGPWAPDPKHVFGPVQHPKYSECLEELACLGARSYDFFGLIAGVRSMTQSLYEPRGLPEDVSKELSDIYEIGTYHSSSWLWPFELERALNKHFKRRHLALTKQDYEDPFKGEWRLDYSAIIYIDRIIDMERAENLLLNTNNKTEFRFVFWFDS
jgi:hypothetical protein